MTMFTGVTEQGDAVVGLEVWINGTGILKIGRSTVVLR